MTRNSTFYQVFLCKKFSLVLTALLLFVSQFAFSHNVDAYSPSCYSTSTGYMYKISANVSSVNTGSRYKWQYKKTSTNTWVCLTEGSNSINGQTYNVIGTSSTGTAVSPLIITNPSSSLQGVIIRCIISDNAEPCTLPSGNTYNTGTNSLNFSININSTPCANNLLDVGNRVWYDVNNNGRNDGEANGEFGISNLVVKLYADANNDNVADGAAITTTTTDYDGYYMFNDKAAGNYIVGVTPPAGYMSSTVNGGDPDNDNNLDDNGQVFVGNEVRGLAITLATGTEYDGSTRTTNTNITYDFGFLPDCSCTNSGNNLLVNGNFENGTIGWSATGGTVTTGTGYVACGTKNGFNNWASGTSTVFQDVNVSPGAILTFKGFSGTHDGGIGCSPKLSLVFYNGNTRLSTNQGSATVTQNVDDHHDQLAQYTVTATAPSNATKVRVEATINCNVLKMDAFCLTSSNILQLGDRVWYDTNNDGILNSTESGIANLTVSLYLDADNNDVADGAAIATDVTDINGYYSFGGLAAGNYIVGVTPPAGYVSSLINGGDPDNSTDGDDNGAVYVGAEVRGKAITLVNGSEPSGNTNNTYDFGFLPDCNCTNSSSNLLTNGSFENGTTGWLVGNSTFTVGTGFVACGTKNGFNDANGTGTAYVFQEFAATPGTTFTFKGFAGTHTAGLSCSPKLIMTFRNASGANIVQYEVAVTRDVDVNHNQLEQYTVSGTAPAGTVTMRVHGAINCNTLKMDAFCLTSTCTAPGTPVVGTVTQPTCAISTGSVALSNLPAGNWTLSRTNGNGVVNTQGSGTTATINGLPTGTYTFTVKNSVGCVSASTTNVVINAQPATPVAPTLNEIDPTCTVATGGFVIASPVGTGYTYSVDNGAYTTTTTYTNFAANTTHTVKAKNAAGCISPVTSITIKAQPVTPSALNYTVTDGICGTGGTATIIVTNLPAGEWTINYPGGIFNGNDATDTLLVSGVYAGTYPITVTNDDGCTSPQTTVTVTQSTPTAKLGGLTWIDNNKNGYRDQSEVVLANVPVSLYKDVEADGIVTGVPLATTTTNASGVYSFPALCYGNFIVKFGLPNSTTPYVRTSSPNKLGKDVLDSDADQASGNTGTIHLNGNETDNTNDAGYYPSSILPVTFGKVTAQPRNCEVYVDFEVLTQKNTNQFVVEYSSSNNNANWTSIAIIPAKDNNTSSYKYSFKHGQPVEGFNMYRIKSVDMDGAVNYSSVASAFSNCAGKISVSTYPNPVRNLLTVSLSADLKNVQLQVYDASGKMIISDTKESGAIRQLNTDKLSVGMYLLKVIQNGNVILTQKIIKE